MKNTVSMVFFYPTRFHIFDQLSTHAFNDELFQIYSVYPWWYFKDKRFAKLGRYNRTLWLGLVLFTILNLAERTGIRGKFLRRLRKLYITGCETEFRLRTLGITKPGIIIASAGYLGRYVSKLKNAGHSVVINHGSLYERHEREILLTQFGNDGDEENANWTHPWLINRMDDEYEQADRIILCSPTAVNTFPEHYHTRIRLVPLGAENVRCGSKQRHRRARSGVTFLHISNLSRRKNLGAILDAFDRIRTPNDRLVIGGPTPRNSNLYHRLLELEPSVTWLGRLDRNGVKTAMSEADIFVHPSFADGWAMVVTEALATGLPIVASAQTGAAAYYKKHSALGSSSILLATPNDTDDIARAMAEIRTKVLATPNLQVTLPMSWETSSELLKETLSDLRPSSRNVS